jgi:hypothetical protein
VAARLRAPLAEDLAAVEVAREQRLEVTAAVLDEVMRVGRRLRRLVRPRSREDEHAVVAQHASDVAEERIAIREVLERLERADHVEAPVVEGRRLEIVDAELDVRFRVPRSGVRDGVLAQVDAHDLGRRIGEECAPVAHAARSVEHALARGVRQREAIALLVDGKRPRGRLVGNDALGVSHPETVSWAVVGVIRRLPLDAAAAVLLPVTVVLFAFGSSSVRELVSIGSKGRWLALLVLAGIAIARVFGRGVRLPAPPAAWAVAAVLVVVGVESALWSVDPRLTIGRIFTVGVLFVTAAALALGDDPQAAATQVLLGVLRGIGAVAVISLLVLAVSHGDAVLPATAGAGWRFRGVGLNPNTVSMLLAIGLPVAVWRTQRARWEGFALVLLFAGEIGFSGSRGALLAGFAGAIVTAVVLAPSPARKAAAAAALVVLALVAFESSKLPQPEPVVAAPPSSGPQAKPTRGADVEQVFRLEDELGFPLGGAYRPPAPRSFLGSSGRAQAWDGALRQGARRPVAGYGFGTENHVFVDRFFAFQGGFVENTYIGLFLQLGLTGIVLFAALLATLAWSGVRAVRRGVVAPQAACGLGVLLAAALIGMTQTGLLSVGNIAASSIWVCVLMLPLLARA